MILLVIKQQSFNQETSVAMASKTLTVDPIEQMQAHNGQSECVQSGTLTGSADTHCENDHSTGDIDHQKEVIPNSQQVNGADGDNGTRPIIVTGFGEILPGDSNLTTYVMREFFWMKNGFFDYKSEQIPIQTGSPDMMIDHNNLQPVTASYEFLRKPSFDAWLRCTKARLAVHLGTKYEAHGNEIIFEYQACNGRPGFWTQDNYGPIFNEKCVPCGRPSLQTAFDIPMLQKNVQERVSNTACLSGINFLFNESTNAGTFLCNFLYYRSLYYASQRDDGKENVMFIHIPTADHLSSDITPVILASVLEQIIYSLLDMCSDEGERETTPLPRAIENGHEKLASGVEKQDEESCVCKGALVPQNGYHEQALSSRYQHPCITDQENHKDQYGIISHPLKLPIVIKNAVVLTGFDPIFNNMPNQSWKIVQKFCTLFQQKDGNIEHNSIPFQLETGPQSRPNIPIITTYNYITSHDFDDWLRSSNALLYIHLGTTKDLNKEPGNVFSFERFAANGDANFWLEDKSLYKFRGPCIEGGKDTLPTLFSDEQLSNLFSRLSIEVGKEKINGEFTFQPSNDAGQFLCDFLYYRSLYYATLRNEASVDGRRSYVIFIHVPSQLKPNNLAAVAPMALVLNLIVHGLFDVILAPN